MRSPRRFLFSKYVSRLRIQRQNIFDATGARKIPSSDNLQKQFAVTAVTLNSLVTVYRERGNFDEITSTFREKRNDRGEKDFQPWKSKAQSSEHKAGVRANDTCDSVAFRRIVEGIIDRRNTQRSRKLSGARLNETTFS